MVPWYGQLILYFVSIFISLFALSHIEWANIIRNSRREFAWITYAFISVVLGFLLGYFLLKLIEIFYNIA